MSRLTSLTRSLAGPVMVALVVGLVVSAVYLARPAFLERMELAAYDWRLTGREDLAPGQVVAGQVVIVAVDEESLARAGRWPWDRAVFARLVQSINAAAPHGVAYDIVYGESQPNVVADELNRLGRNAEQLGLPVTPQLRDYVRERLAATDGDLQLARALAEGHNAGIPQVLGYYFRLEQADEGARPSTGTLDKAARYFERVVGQQPTGAPPVPRGTGYRANIDPIVRGATLQGAFNILPDADGVIRRYSLAMAHEGALYATLAPALYSRAIERALPFALLDRNGLVGFQWERHTVPTNAQGQMLLNYQGPGGTVPHIPAWHLLEPAGSEVHQEAMARLAGRYVLVGVTAPTVFDMRVTPFGVAYPGVEIHATALETMLSQEFIARPAWAPLFDLSAIWFFVLFTVVVLWGPGAVWTAVGAVVTGGLFFWFSGYLFEVREFWVAQVYPLLGFVAALVCLSLYKYLFEELQKRRITNIFGKYLDPQVVEEVTAEGGLALGGQRAELSVLFADLHEFTQLAEELSPEELVRLLGDHLSEMTDVVLAERGLLDKYIGDAVMAVFGAPRKLDDHAVAACSAAVAMHAALARLNASRAGAGQPELAMGIGINTGEVVAGNMGSRERVDYTVVGDAVNVAARLERLTRHYGVGTIVGEATRMAVEDRFWLRPLDRVRVRGRSQPVEIFELIGPIEGPQPYTYMPQYLEMVEAFRAKHFAEAAQMADELHAAHPEDTTVALYARHARRYAASFTTDSPECPEGICSLEDPCV